MGENFDVSTRLWQRIGWRGLILVLVFGCGFAAFLMGAEVGDRAYLPRAGVLAKLYYTLGLFVLGGLDLGTPSGGPTAARWLLWLAYFAAPAVTASAIIDGLLSAMRPQDFRLRRLRGHVVIAGGGRLAMLYMRRLREARPKVPIVMVKLDSGGAYEDEIRAVHHAELVHGDIASAALLQRLRLDRAERVLLLTGDDFANLDAAARILSMVPELGPRIVIHVSDLRFMLGMSHTKVAKVCETFNTHQIAASHLVETQILEHFEATAPRDRVVLAGFGRFGQTVLQQLQDRAHGCFDTVVLLDLDALAMASVFEEQVGFSDNYRREVIAGDLKDPLIWRQLDEQFQFGDCEPVFIVGSGDDSTNLRTAIWLAKRYPRAQVVARSFRRSTFADEVASELGFSTVSVADLSTQSMPDRWFAHLGAPGS